MSEQTSAVTAVEAELRELEERLLMPAVRGSKQALSEILADSFIEFASSGRSYNKQQIIEALGVETDVRLSLSDFRITLLSADTALATYIAIKHVGAATEPTPSLRSSIWQRRGGRWQVVFHQGTLAKTADAP